MVAALQRLDPTMVASLLIEQPLYPQLFEQIFPLVQCPTFMIRGNPALGSVVRDQDVTLMQTYTGFI